MGERPPSPLASRERLVLSIPMLPDAQYRYAEQLRVDLATLLLLMLAEEPAQRPSMKEVTLELLRLSYKVEYEELIGLARALEVDSFRRCFRICSCSATVIAGPMALVKGRYQNYLPGP